MNDSNQSSETTAARSLFVALQSLRERANRELGHREAGRIFSLMRELMLRLPHRDLTGAEVNDIRKAGQEMLAGGRSKEDMRLVQKGLTALFDVACSRGLVDRNPIRNGGCAKDGPPTETLVVTERRQLTAMIRSVLRARRGDVEVEPCLTGAMEMARWYPFRQMVCWYPQKAPGVERFLREVRGDTSPTRHAGLVLVTRPSRLEEAEVYLGRGSNRVLAESEIDSLEAVLESLVDAAPRLDMKVPLRVTAAGLGHAGTALWQVENISAAGMLVRTRTVPKMGSVFGCELSLPGDPKPVKGRAEVVREALDDRDGLLGIGARFVDFEEDGKGRLNAYLNRRLDD